MPSDLAPTRSPTRHVLPLALFLATIITTTSAGALYVHQGSGIAPIHDGLPFSVPLLAILVAHELGHYFTARIHGVPASLPYFIPLPPMIGLFGTMGAIIGMRSMTTDRRKLIDIGASGPLAGLIVAIPVLAYGISLSPVGPPSGDTMQEGNSILYAVLKYAVTGRWLPGEGVDVQMHPTALAGWAGLLVTMINLIPLGQLDGGHIAAAFFGNRWNRFVPRLQRAPLFLALAVVVWVYLRVAQEVAQAGRQDIDRALVTMVAVNAGLVWVVWWGLTRVIHRLGGGLEHPPVDDSVPLPASRKLLFWVVAVAFVAIFIPVPLRHAFGPADGGKGASPTNLTLRAGP